MGTLWVQNLLCPPPPQSRQGTTFCAPPFFLKGGNILRPPPPNKYGLNFKLLRQSYLKTLSVPLFIGAKLHLPLPPIRFYSPPLLPVFRDHSLSLHSIFMRFIIKDKTLVQPNCFDKLPCVLFMILKMLNELQTPMTPPHGYSNVLYSDFPE